MQLASPWYKNVRTWDVVTLTGKDRTSPMHVRPYFIVVATGFPLIATSDALFTVIVSDGRYTSAVMADHV